MREFTVTAVLLGTGDSSDGGDASDGASSVISAHRWANRSACATLWT